MRLKQNITLCLFTLVSISVFGQTEIGANLLWSDVHITKEIHHDFSAKVKLSYFNNIPSFSPRFIDVGFNYEPFNKLTVGTYYRFEGVFQTTSQRIYLEAAYKNIKIKPLGITLTPRVRVQHRLKAIDEMTDFRSYQIRHRIMIKKTLRHCPNTTLYTAIESFHSTTQDNKVTYDRLRSDIGCRYDIPHTKHQIRISYRNQIDIENGQKQVSSMINIGYDFRF